MKLLKSLVFLALSFIAGAEAQASIVRLPAANSTIHQGKNFTVQVIRPNSIEGSLEVGLAIGVLHCTSTPCQADPISQLGVVLYNGGYNPQLHEIPGEPYQNFSVVIPQDFIEKGVAQLGVVRLFLIGAGPASILEERAIPIIVK